MTHDPRAVARHYRYRKLIWPAQAPPWLVLVIVLPFETLVRVALIAGIFYALYSCYAADAAVEQGAESRFPEDDEQ